MGLLDFLFGSMGQAIKNGVEMDTKFRHRQDAHFQKQFQYAIPILNKQLVEMDNFKEELELKTMAQQTKHTPLQWNNNLKDGHVYCSGGIQVATCYSSFRGPETIKANAELIVKAVNNHDKLVDMLQELLKIHTDSTYGDNVWRLLVAEKAEQLLQSLKD